MGIIDKFELVCADIFDESFVLPEKVDCIVASYTLTTFINNMDMCKDILSQCKKVLKPGGHVLLCDFEYVKIPNENFWCGMYTSEERPEEFKTFKFYIDTQPDEPYEIFNIPVQNMFLAGKMAGFDNITYRT